MSTKTIIINLMTNIFDDPTHDHTADYEKVEHEYLSAAYNPDVDIFIFLLFSGKDKKNALKMRQLKKGAGKFEFEDGTFNSEFDFGDPDNLKVLFSELNEMGNYTNRILVTWDHGYGYLMFKNEITRSDKFLWESLFNQDWFKKLWATYGTVVETSNPGTAWHSNTELMDKPGIKDNGHTTNEANDQPLLEAWKIFAGNLIFSTKMSSPVYLDADYPVRFNPIFTAKQLTALTINELADGIERSSIKKFDLIVMSNCYMQNIDTTYALQNCCNYLIAPQTTFPWESYDFGALVPQKNERIDDTFCKNILAKTQKSLNQKITPSNGDVTLDEIGFSCIKTTQCGSFFKDLKKITDFLSAYYSRLSDDIYFAANQICDLTNPKRETKGVVNLYQIDLTFFLEFLNTRWSKYPAFSMPYAQVKKILDNNNFILENRKGDLFYWDASSPVPKNACKGLSIFFPKNKTSYENSTYAEVFIDDGVQTQTKFSKDFGWGLFLEEFFGQYN